MGRLTNTHKNAKYLYPWVHHICIQMYDFISEDRTQAQIPGALPSTGWQGAATYFATGFVAGAFGSAVGLGGGVLVVPLLVSMGPVAGQPSRRVAAYIFLLFTVFIPNSRC